jgi:hypothetical protein
MATEVEKAKAEYEKAKNARIEAEKHVTADAKDGDPAVQAHYAALQAEIKAERAYIRAQQDEEIRLLNAKNAKTKAETDAINAQNKREEAELKRRQEAMQEIEKKRIQLSGDGNVTLVEHQTVTEEEIHEDTEWITIKLDGIYWELTEAMKPYQKEWDADPTMALANALMGGAAEGGGAWVEDFGEMFNGETWKNAANWVGEIAGSARDVAVEYAQEKYEETKALLSAPGKTIFSWSWWGKQVDDVKKSVSETADSAVRAGKAAKDAIETAIRIWQARDEIVKLPNMIITGDVNGIESFFLNTLPGIDKELADEINNSPNKHAVLALIDDPDSVLTYMNYLALTLEAIPPNFYAYLGGKAGVYILCEVILLLVTMIFSAGAATALRVSALLGRITMSSSKVASATKKIEHAMQALKAFEKVIVRFKEVAEDLRALGTKLHGRKRGLRAAGASRTKIPVKRKPEKREPRCAICHSKDHHTPGDIKRGCVVYK